MRKRLGNPADGLANRITFGRNLRSAQLFEIAYLKIVPESLDFWMAGKDNDHRLRTSGYLKFP
jgi:hypothetical protein